MLKRRLIITSAAMLVSSLSGNWIGPVVSVPAASYAAEQRIQGHALRSGDLVRLRSGGPLMTVNTIEGDQVNCFWSTEEGNVLSGSFPIFDLTAPIAAPPG